jgi:addiction module RelB/DinJ family antitoxin
MANINVRTDDQLKEAALKIFKELGIDMSTAINIFLSQVVLRQAIPFDLSIPIHKDDKKTTLMSLFGSINDPTFNIDDTPTFERPRERML